jgi:hypothetical protein
VYVSIGEKIIYSPTKKRNVLEDWDEPEAGTTSRAGPVHVRTIKARKQGILKDDINLGVPAEEIDFTRAYKFVDGLYLVFEWREEGLCISQSEFSMD